MDHPNQKTNKKSTAFWWETTIRFNKPLPPDSPEISIIGNVLIQLGSHGAEEIYKKGKCSALKGYYSNQYNKPKILKTIKENIQNDYKENFIPFSICLTKFTDISWSEEWKKYAKPILIDKSLGILPTFSLKCPPSFPKKMAILRLDPGLAFGTGSHPTTYLCLKELVALLIKEKKIIKHSLDCGTGSGILALAIKVLSGSRVLALDNDLMAIQTARENARKNKQNSHIQFQKGSVESIKGKFDLIVANIQLSFFEKNLKFLRSLLIPHGFLILSGLLSSEEKKIKTLLKEKHFKILKTKKYRGWLCLRVKRNRF